MNAAIFAVGRLKEDWQRAACAEYLKRLSRYGGYQVVEVEDEREPDKPSPALEARVKEAEARRLLKVIRPEDHVVALCIQAPMPDSVGLAEKMAQWQMGGRRVAFVIGGSLGLGEAVLARANERLSFSRLTFPHPLMRVILLEQLYRGERINAGERYHK